MRTLYVVAAEIGLLRMVRVNINTTKAALPAKNLPTFRALFTIHVTALFTEGYCVDT